jgi:hypothetical protein
MRMTVKIARFVMNIVSDMVYGYHQPNLALRMNLCCKSQAISVSASIQHFCAVFAQLFPPAIFGYRWTFFVGDAVSESLRALRVGRATQSHATRVD